MLHERRMERSTKRYTTQSILYGKRQNLWVENIMSCKGRPYHCTTHLQSPHPIPWRTSRNKKDTVLLQQSMVVTNFVKNCVARVKNHSSQRNHHYNQHRGLKNLGRRSKWTSLENNSSSSRELPNHCDRLVEQMAWSHSHKQCDHSNCDQLTLRSVHTKMPQVLVTDNGPQFQADFTSYKKKMEWCTRRPCYTIH